MIDRLEFDTIYHEHLCYFSLCALSGACERSGLDLVDVVRVPVHGGSTRAYLSRQDATPPAESAGRGRVAELLAAEAKWGVLDDAPYQRFAQGVGSLRGSLRALLAELKAAGRSIAAYGAAAKGTILMNYCGIGAETIDFVTDRSKAKHGLLVPGNRLPIYPPEKLLEARPDYVLLLAWNFADEIMPQQAEYRRGGGRFIVPVPQPTIV